MIDVPGNGLLFKSNDNIEPEKQSALDAVIIAWTAPILLKYYLLLALRKKQGFYKYKNKIVF